MMFCDWCSGNILHAVILFFHFQRSRSFYQRSPHEIRASHNVHFAGNDITDDKGIRLNKVFKARFSRRQAEELVKAGRVTINGLPVESKGGWFVVPFLDKVELDGKLVSGWEEMNGLTRNKNDSKTYTKSNDMPTNEKFDYFKYWKPKGVTCTTDKKISSNIVDAVRAKGCSPKHRIFPVGRLDKDSTGLILLTSDGRLPNSLLRGEFKQPKTYEVFVDKPLNPRDIEKLADGVVITTIAQRDNKKQKPLTARTKPCVVEQIDTFGLRITLIEGRNRQIRKMLAVLDYDVIKLHRVAFCGMKLSPLQRPGQWAPLSKAELKSISSLLKS